MLSHLFPLWQSPSWYKSNSCKKREQRALVVVLPPKFVVTNYVPISCSYCFFTSSTILHLHTSKKILHSTVLSKFLDDIFSLSQNKNKYIPNRKLISGRDQGQNVCWLCGKRNKENKLGRRCKCTNMKRKDQMKQFTDFSKKINATVFLFINNWLLDDYKWSIMYLRRAAIMAVLLIQNLNISIFYILQESNVIHTKGFKNNCLITTTCKLWIICPFQTY